MSRKRGDFGVGHGLGNSNNTDGDTGNQVTIKPGNIVLVDPLKNWEKRNKVIDESLEGEK